MEKDLLKPQLIMDDKGNRICLCVEEPQCRRCGERIKKRDTIYFCSASKDVYCYKCEHSKTFWSCKVGDFMNDEHIDFMCVLEIKKEGMK